MAKLEERKLFILETARRLASFLRHRIAAATFCPFARYFDTMKCERCQGSHWVCEDHPTKPMFHNDCGGAGMPCPSCNPMSNDKQVVVKPQNQ